MNYEKERAIEIIRIKGCKEEIGFYETKIKRSNNKEVVEFSEEMIIRCKEIVTTSKSIIQMIDKHKEKYD